MQAFALALRDVLMVQSESLQQLSYTVLARRKGEADNSSIDEAGTDVTSSCEVTVLEVLVHTAALRHQLRLLDGLQMSIDQTTGPGAHAKLFKDQRLSWVGTAAIHLAASSTQSSCRRRNGQHGYSAQPAPRSKPGAVG